ncbi:MAG: hypothetical protein GY795_16060 [Desulfobacterales bacterium]|nr:hypothetical protein [Desulfobacterales bacterium]
MRNKLLKSYIIASLVIVIFSISGISVSSALSEKEVSDLSEQYRMRAREYEEKQELQRAITSLKIAGNLAPGNKEILFETERLVKRAKLEAKKHFKKGLSYVEENDLKAARGEFITALRYNPDFRRPVRYLKKMLQSETFMMYSVEKKDTLKTIALKVYQDYKKDFLIAYFNDLDQNKPLAPGTVLKLPVLDSTLVQKEFDAEDALSMAKFYFELEEYDLVLAVSKKILRHDSSNAEAADLVNASCHQMGIVLGRQGRYDQALEILNKIDPDYLGVQDVINNYSARNKVQDKVQKKVRKKVQDEVLEDVLEDVQDEVPEDVQDEVPEDVQDDTLIQKPLFNVEDAFNNAKFYLELEEYDKAHAIAGEILEYDNSNKEARELANASLYRKGMQLSQQDKYYQALEILNEITEHPGVPETIAEVKQTMKNKTETHFRQGVKYFADDKLEEAVEEWEKTLEFDPEYPNAEKEIENARTLILYRDGMKLSQQGEYGQALEILNKITEHPGVPEAITELEQTMKTKAEEHYRQGVKYFVDEKLKEAVEEWEKTLEFDPEHSNAEKEIENTRNLIQKLKKNNQ